MSDIMTMHQLVRDLEIAFLICEEELNDLELTRTIGGIRRAIVDQLDTHITDMEVEE